MDAATLLTQLQEAKKLNDEHRGTISSLRSDYDALMASTCKVMDESRRLQQQVEELQAINRELTHRLYGRRSERRPDSPGQGHLPFVHLEPESVGEPGVIIASESPQAEIDAELIRRWKERRKRRRQAPRSEEFPAHMERRERVIDLSDELKAGLTYIGDDRAERMVLEKPKAVIEVIRRRKYVVKGQPERGVLAAPPPLSIVEGCKYDFTVIGTIIANKYAFHQPTYRQQDWFAQCGWFPSRSTINELLNVSVDTIQPLLDQMWWLLLRQRILLTDETRVLLLTRGALTKEQLTQLRRRKKAKGTSSADNPPELSDAGSVSSYAWLFAGLDDLAPYNVFHWSLTRQQATIDDLLASYQGFVVADAYDAYVHIEQRSRGRIQHASCNAHARREFVQSELYEPILSAQILSLYGQLYEIEQRGKLMTVEGRLALRQREAVPLWKRIEAWLNSDAVTRASLPRSRFGKAVGYLRNQWSSLQKYLTNGLLPIDNDQGEQIIRPLAVGRNNWMFLGHPVAAPGRMRLLSIVSSAHRHNLKIDEYLVDTLRKLADASQNHPGDLQLNSPYLLALLPDRWAAAHPESIRQGRVLEKRNVAEDKQARRAMRRQLAQTSGP